MNDTLMYFLKVNIAIALFYLFYRLFFAGDTFWKTRRFYLLFSIALSFVYPFFSLEQWLQQQEPVQQLIISAVMLPEYVVQPASTPTTNYFSLENILIGIYALVLLALTVRMITQLVSIGRFRMIGKTEIIQNVRVLNISKEITPFSFFGSIYINASFHTEAELEQILAHELTHVRQMHSFDVLVSEMLCNVFWFNPATWLLKREIRQNLEFLADNKVLESGFDSKTYQYHLLQLAYQTPELKIANKFNVSPLKKRITMMNQQKTNKARLLKYSLIVPLALALVVSSNAQEIVEKAKNAMVTETQKTEFQQVDNINLSTKIDLISDTTTISDDKGRYVVYSKVDKMPQFPGGDVALMEFVSKNIKYPESARENGVQGTSVISFVIDRTGKIIYAKVIRSLDSITDAEAIRVIKLLPKWIPGENKGKKVDVAYTLPIRYRLDAGDTKKEETDIITQTPEYPGGAAALMKFISMNMRYPTKARDAGVQAKVLVQFTVGADGTIENKQILKSETINNSKSQQNKEQATQNMYNKLQNNEALNLGEMVVNALGNAEKTTVKGDEIKLLENEALRVVGMLPKFTPGQINGKNAAVKFILPISFKLNNDNQNLYSSQGEYLSLGNVKGEKPLLVVDDKIVSEAEFKAIKTSNIMNISVLKDASAKNIWGEKGKNGVISIKLK